MESNVTSILITPYILNDARKWALQHGMIVLPTWKLTKYMKDKFGIKIDVVKWSKQFLDRTRKTQTLSEFIEKKVRRSEAS